ncbi:MAG: anaerobic ribonucleoside-triphosphate reductase activating protein [Anaerotignum sp.]|jgi:anaerobic ribonucleoside-triphosphate reductase activating protein|nr:anaerobic ribonucleoside-triphosphate reductase activating protein [Anaerotignum sp.]
MNYHDILHDDMRNGSGLRVVLFVSGCSNHCDGCHNPQTHDPSSGIEFDIDAKTEIINEMKHDYISGLTISGGDPLHPDNILTVYNLCREIKTQFPNKTIWIYSGYTFEQIYIHEGSVTTDDFNVTRNIGNDLLRHIDVLVDGKFVKHLADINYPYAGSTNQRVIDVQKTLKYGKIILYRQG